MLLPEHLRVKVIQVNISLLGHFLTEGFPEKLCYLASTDDLALQLSLNLFLQETDFCHLMPIWQFFSLFAFFCLFQRTSLKYNLYKVHSLRCTFQWVLINVQGHVTTTQSKRQNASSLQKSFPASSQSVLSSATVLGTTDLVSVTVDHSGLFLTLMWIELYST